MADIRRRCRTGRGSGTCLIGKESPLRTVHNDRADPSGHNLAESECLGEDAPEHIRKLACIFHNDEQCDKEVAGSHDRHHDIQHFHRCIFPEDDDRRDHNQYDGRINGRHMECIFKR